MKFFVGCRPQFYFDGGKLTLDKKTGKQIWTLKMAITMKGEEIVCCDDVILHNFMAISKYENLIEEMCITQAYEGVCVEFYALGDHHASVLACVTDLTDLRLTREGNLTELHLQFDIENTDKVHQFVRNHVFTRLWVEFAEQQRTLPLGQAKTKTASIDDAPKGPVN